MKITSSKLRRIIKEELLREGEVIPMDFRSKRVRKTLMPQVSDCFIFSGDGGQIANVTAMQRDSSDDGGTVSYEQYIQRDGEWIQEPAQTLTKSLLGFSSRYKPYTGTIEHLNKRKSEHEEDEAHMEKVMSAQGFPDYQNKKHDMDSPEYFSAYRKAASTLPSVRRVTGRDF